MSSFKFTFVLIVVTLVVCSGCRVYKTSGITFDTVADQLGVDFPIPTREQHASFFVEESTGEIWLKFIMHDDDVEEVLQSVSSNQNVEEHPYIGQSIPVFSTMPSRYWWQPAALYERVVFTKQDQQYAWYMVKGKSSEHLAKNMTTLYIYVSPLMLEHTK